MMITLGMTFPILEPNIKDVLMARMEKVDMEKAKKEVQERVKHSIRCPQPLFEKARCTKHRTWLYDPTATLERDVIDMNGHVLVNKGTTYNPLHHRNLSTQLVFIEGTEQEQIAWALQQPKSKIILVSGSPICLEEKHQVPIYFDQGGHLCAKFGICAFPARVHQDGDRLRCEELAVLSFPEGGVRRRQ